MTRVLAPSVRPLASVRRADGVEGIRTQQATSPRTRVRGRRTNAGAPPTPRPRAARAVLRVPVAATAPHATPSHSYASVVRARAAAQAGTATCAPLRKHGAQGQRPTAPKSLCASRRPRRLLLQRRQPPSIKPHHRGTPPQPTRPANPHHDRRSTPQKPKFRMTAPPAKTRKRPPCRCLVCDAQHPWAAV